MDARRFAAVFGAVYVLVGIALNQPDNVLHLGSALLGLYFGLAGRRRAAVA